MCAVDGSESVVSTDLRTTVSADVLTIDLASRHVPPDDAAARATSVEQRSLSPDVRSRPTSGDSDRVGHKVDSLLRGNWAAELLARHRVAGRRVVLVPAFPAMGRTCRGGVVRAHGVPVGELADARARHGRVVRRSSSTPRSSGSTGSTGGCAATARSPCATPRPTTTCGRSPRCSTPIPTCSSPDLRERLPRRRTARRRCRRCRCRRRRSSSAAACTRRPGGSSSLWSGSPASPCWTTPARRRRRRRRRGGRRGAGAPKRSTALDGIAHARHRRRRHRRGGARPRPASPSAVPLAAGMPWCPRALDRDVQLVTKAGAFGDDGTIARLVRGRWCR